MSRSRNGFNPTLVSFGGYALGAGLLAWLCGLGPGLLVASALALYVSSKALDKLR